MRHRLLAMTRDRAIAEAALIFVSGWEFGSLASRHLRPSKQPLYPPWTALVQPLPTPVKAAIVGGAVAWFVPHMMRSPSDG